MIKMAQVKKGDFIEIEYTGSLKETGQIFDTSDESIAKSNDLTDQVTSYGPIVVCVGQNQVIKGIDEELIGKEPEKSYKIDVPQKIQGALT